MTVDDAVRNAEVVITCTASRETLVRRDQLGERVHVTALGSDGVGKKELDPDVLRAADIVGCDSREQCSRLGELQHAPDQLERAVELGEIASGGAGGRVAETGLSVCDLTGVGVQDVAAAALVLERATGGRRLER
jgi:ornithine cyclodeaminase